MQDEENPPIHPFQRLLKILIWVLTFPVIVLIACSLIFSIYYSPEYVRRVLAWRQADVYDYQKFPARPIDPSPAVYQFNTVLNETDIRQGFQTIFQTDDLDAYLAEQDTQAFIVIQEDAIRYEHYYNGMQRDSIVTSFSVAKSFTSALIGIAIQEGLIQDVSDPIVTYLPELESRDPSFAKITIRNLLMMSSGIKYVEFPFFNGDDALTYYYPNLRELALWRTRIENAPGETFLYNNYHPLLLGLVLERAVHMPVAVYLEKKIWQPIGAQYDASWSLDSEASNFEKMESGINARAIDFARFGRLFLRHGDWQGVQVMPADWVVESTTEDTSLDYRNYYPAQGSFADGEGYYKYMWWGRRREGAASDFYAAGNHGQYIYISPSRKLIIVRNGEGYGRDGTNWSAAFYQYASSLPAIQPSK